MMASHNKHHNGKEESRIPNHTTRGLVKAEDSAGEEDARDEMRREPAKKKPNTAIQNKNHTTRTIRALIHLGCQPRGAVDDDDEEDEGKHAMKKQFDTTCTIEFIWVPVDESEPQSFNSQCASSIERGADTTERSGIEGEEVLACTVVVFVGEIPWIAKQLSGDVDEKEMRGELEEVVPIHSPPKRAALLRSSICSSSSLHSERVVR
ncbi:hypothetical protein BLNAU_10993 [Blattamonas nauphoetae]|uniref:Uncharacterized protein n=1 Tax=Blattamonas nauphoetae TaxID=2049346 RepID=A0ABQ9XRP2_9EUKA|nr:hypothetical protein BLNAU_10993 [Blattamonas nauphoetae]